MFLPEQKDTLAEKMAAVGVGVTPEKNCVVESISGNYDVLRCLVGQRVNIDEVQYQSGQ